MGSALGKPADFPGGDLLADRGLDSLTSIQLTLSLEDDFDIVFADDEISLEHFATIDTIVQLLETKIDG
ncbi:hypothetical protein GTY92_21205 [Streptomyces sp. SID4950]|nr:hypothetical protein [Streptomyces sp. SID4950]